MACLLAVAFPAGALTLSNRYRSPRNPERDLRKATRLIVLHTTEAGARSSLNKLCERGECHYCVTEDGTVYRIVDRDREAFHAGRSMWDKAEDCDKFSIGIEVVGRHDKPITLNQVDAIRELVGRLKQMYGVKDAQVVCHSHVAYGAPNKWHRQRHRGRKRCGMLFAMPSVRRQLGLGARPTADPDVKARRLVQGDPYLAKVLYGNVDTMRGRVGRNVEPSSSIFSGLKSLFSSNETRPAAPAPPSAAKAPPSAAKAPPSATKAPSSATKASPSAVKARSAEPRKPEELTFKLSARHLAALTKKGYVKGGPVSPKLSAMRIAGKKWNDATTYYVHGGTITPGNAVDAAKIKKGTWIYYKP